MTALESLFNSGTSQIAHTISRHLSLIISKNKEEFHRKYKEIKKLYGTLNKIVHGIGVNRQKVDLEKSMLNLQVLTREAILHCLESGIGKNELFDHLDSRGF